MICWLEVRLSGFKTCGVAELYLIGNEMEFNDEMEFKLQWFLKVQPIHREGWEHPFLGPTTMMWDAKVGCSGLHASIWLQHIGRYKWRRKIGRTLHCQLTQDSFHGNGEWYHLALQTGLVTRLTSLTLSGHLFGTFTDHLLWLFIVKCEP